MKTFMFGAIFIFIILILILFLLSIINKKKYTYESVEKEMVSAAKNYFKDNPEQLPQEDGGIVEIDSSNLVASGKMDDFSSYLKDGNTCAGSVQVEKKNSDYNYTPYLNCGDNYVTIELYKKVTDTSNIVTSGYGLYKNEDNYIFRGEDLDNYVELEKALWRIVKINNNNEIILVLNETAGDNTAWDDRYNPNSEYNSGINSYKASRIKDTLVDIYNNRNEAKDEYDKTHILTENDLDKLVTFNLCVGKRKKDDEGYNIAGECSDLATNQVIGLLTASDYMQASIDPNCKTVTSPSCGNYNYLNINKNWWLATANADSTFEVYYIKNSGMIATANAANYHSVRPVVRLSSSVLYKEGNGTLDDPYKIK